MHLIHYGSSLWNPKKFKLIRNRAAHVKPVGGLWASPVGTAYGWKEWCTREDFRISALEENFTFWYQGDRVITVNCKSDLRDISWRKFDFSEWWEFPNYEKMVQRRIDAIHVTIKGEQETRLLHGRNLYGYDCECVLILNPKGIENGQGKTSRSDQSP